MDTTIIMVMIVGVTPINFQMAITGRYQTVSTPGREEEGCVENGTENNNWSTPKSRSRSRSVSLSLSLAEQDASDKTLHFLLAI